MHLLGPIPLNRGTATKLPRYLSCILLTRTGMCRYSVFTDSAVNTQIRKDTMI